MQVDIIAIGNSKGIRIPKALLKECGFEKSVELSVENKRLIMKKPGRKPREGWDESFKKMAEHGEDIIIDDFPPTTFDEEEWEW